MTKLGIYNQQDINNLMGYRVAHTQLDLLQQGYCSILDTSQLPDELAQSCATLVPASRPSILTGRRGLRQESLISALPLAESFLSAFVDLTALLRTDVEIKGQTFSMDEAALVAEVFRAARRSDGGLNGVTLYYPKFFPPKIINADFKSEILGRLEALHFLKNKVEKLLNDLPQINGQIKKKEDERDALAAEIQSLEQEISEAEREQARLEYLRTQYGAKTPFAADLRLAELIDGQPGLRQKKREKELKKSQAETRLVALQQARLQIIRDLNSDVAGQLPDPVQEPDEFAAAAAKLLVRLAALNEQFAQLIAALKTAEQATGTNPLTRYILAESLLSAMPWQENSYFLQLNVINAGGNNRIKTHLLWDIFTGGNRVSHSGGVIVQFHLFNQDGQSLASDTLTEYTNYIKSGKIKKLPNRCIDELPNVAPAPLVKRQKP